MEKDGRRRITSRALADLEISYMDFMDQYLQSKDLLTDSIYEADPEVFDYVVVFLRKDDILERQQLSFGRKKTPGTH